jgi:hypothetical protein
MKMMDADQDGIVDMNDVREVARGICDRLSDKQPSPASKESQVRFKRRFLGLVTAYFKAADVDGIGKLEEDELRSAPGRNLEKLLMR